MTVVLRRQPPTPGWLLRLAGYRGGVALRVSVRTAAADLHSGGFGGSVANAAHAMAALLAELHTADGAVAAPHFYDAVRTCRCSIRPGRRRSQL